MITSLYRKPFYHIVLVLEMAKPTFEYNTTINRCSRMSFSITDPHPGGLNWPEQMVHLLYLNFMAVALTDLPMLI